jgi:hypothetical protein
MRDPKVLRSLARRCRELANTTARSNIIAQLRLWAAELIDAAERLDRRQGTKTDGERDNLGPCRRSRGPQYRC